MDSSNVRFSGGFRSLDLEPAGILYLLTIFVLKSFEQIYTLNLPVPNPDGTKVNFCREIFCDVSVACYYPSQYIAVSHI